MSAEPIAYERLYHIELLTGDAGWTYAAIELSLQLAIEHAAVLRILYNEPARVRHAGKE